MRQKCNISHVCDPEACEHVCRRSISILISHVFDASVQYLSYNGNKVAPLNIFFKLPVSRVIPQPSAAVDDQY